MCSFKLHVYMYCTNYIVCNLWEYYSVSLFFFYSLHVYPESLLSFAGGHSWSSVFHANRHVVIWLYPGRALHGWVQRLLLYYTCPVQGETVKILWPESELSFCTLLFAATGYPLFPGENEVEQLACIMEVMGLPPQNILEQATRRRLFFGEK